MKYAVVVETTAAGNSACVPDRPGCVNLGNTRDEMERNIGEAIDLYLDELRDRGAPVSEPTTDAAYMAV